MNKVFWEKLIHVVLDFKKDSNFELNAYFILMKNPTHLGDFCNSFPLLFKSEGVKIHLYCIYKFADVIGTWER